ncbi:MAG: MarR family transcriptional regulator [Trueperaceae bacterium]|nr:MAG: MarR family transcriptional regulator [Trueperaceae bacterium]
MPKVPIDPQVNEFRYLILAIQAEGERRLNDALRERDLDLTATQSEVLEILYEGGAMSQSELGERLVCTKGNISRLLDRMEAKRLIRRSPTPTDRRRTQVTLTSDGQQCIEEAFEIIRDSLEPIRTLYSNRELRQLAELLGRITQAFGIDVEARFRQAG